jgi:hypothetical protein
MAPCIQLCFDIIFGWFLHHFLKLRQNHTLTPFRSAKGTLLFLIDYFVIVMYNIFHGKHAGSSRIDP